jgi:hypothetical protein
LRTCMLRICGWNRRQQAAALEAQNAELVEAMVEDVYNQDLAAIEEG